jgi:hypothetical protein
MQGSFNIMPDRDVEMDGTFHISSNNITYLRGMTKCRFYEARTRPDRNT